MKKDLLHFEFYKKFYKFYKNLAQVKVKLYLQFNKRVQHTIKYISQLSFSTNDAN